MAQFMANLWPVLWLNLLETVAAYLLHHAATSSILPHSSTSKLFFKNLENQLETKARSHKYELHQLLYIFKRDITEQSSRIGTEYWQSVFVTVE